MKIYLSCVRARARGIYKPTFLKFHSCRIQKGKLLCRKNITNKILKYLKSVRMFCWKEHGGMYSRSWTSCLCKRAVCGFEVKTQTGRATNCKRQQLTNPLEACWHVRSVDEVRAVLETSGIVSVNNDLEYTAN